ncbi:TPA: hypothetical protein RQL13_004508 [Vibrio vulnificus]|nr:hypothetical protein [Vibrio vulnificus]HAT8516454.1 hypothetical protein [Vibrio vulnificus]HAT8549410.1 hypothetical protein [Vibrio vulnificus]HDY8202092.1 hypothetical protein [Vibrio vulnificus]
MDILNNREIAIALWLLAISVYVYFSPKMVEVRSACSKLRQTFFVSQVISVLGLMIAYMVIVISVLSELALWNVDQIKNTVFWCFSTGFLSLFEIEKLKKDRSHFRQLVVDNLQLLAIFQFVVGVYTFSLWIEVILVPVLAFIGMLLAVAKTDEKYYQVKKVMEYFLLIFGVVLVCYTLYMLVTNFGEFGKEKTVYDFITPPLLTLCYLPFIYMLLVYTTYEQVFTRLTFFIKKPVYRRVAKIYAVVLFNFRLTLLERWAGQVVRGNIESHSDLIDSIKHIFKVSAAEKSPKKIDQLQGWSPYAAKSFLVTQDLSTGYYNKVSENEWWASSQMLEFSDGILPDNIAYYVEGSEHIAKSLKLKVNINDVLGLTQACVKLAKVAEVLHESSLSLPLSEDMKNAILSCSSHSEMVGNKNISLTVEHWKNHKLKGLELKFVVSSI